MGPNSATATIGLTLLVLFCSLACKPERDRPTKLNRVSTQAESHIVTQDRGSRVLGSELSQEQRALVLAEGKGIKLTVGDFLTALNALPLAHRTRYRNPDRWPEFVNDLVALELLKALAIEKNLQRDEKVLYAFKKEAAETYLDHLAGKEVSPGDISPADIKELYEKKPELSRAPALAKLWVFATDDPKDANDTLAFIKEMEGETPLAIGRLCERIPINGVPDLGVGKSGDAGYVDPTGTGKKNGKDVQMIPDVMAARVFEDPRPGRIVGIEHTKRGYQIAVIEDFRAEQKKSLESVSPRIVNLLLVERRDQAKARIRAEVRKRAKIVVDAKAFQKAFGQAPKPVKAVGPAATKKENTKLKLSVRPGRRPIAVKRADEQRIRDSVKEENPLAGEGK